MSAALSDGHRRAVCGAELLGEEIDQHATDSQLSQLRLEKIGEPPVKGLGLLIRVRRICFPDFQSTSVRVCTRECRAADDHAW